MYAAFLGNAYPWVKAAHLIFVIFWMSGPVDLMIATSTIDIETFIPVAHGPSANALITNSCSSGKT